MTRAQTPTEKAEHKAIAAAGLIAESDRYAQLAEERRVAGVKLWDEAQRGGISYARLGALALRHPSKVQAAVIKRRSQRAAGRPARGLTRR